jgi:serine/threonine protein kinase
MPESQARHIFTQLICVLEYLHFAKRIAHRDIKCENILLDNESNIRVIDFGFSRAFETPDDLFHTACGSPCYCAPEVVMRTGYTCSADIWSAGIVLFKMATGEVPFYALDVRDILRMVVKSKPEFPRSISPDLVDLLRRMLCKDPDVRITISGIKSHPWFSRSEYESVVRFMADEQAVGLDPATVEAMEADGIDYRSAITDPEMRVLYRIYKRERLTERMAARRLPSQRNSSLPMMIKQQPSRSPAAKRPMLLQLPRCPPSGNIRVDGRRSLEPRRIRVSHSLSD